MSKSRKVKCPQCEKLNDKEITIKHNNRYWCKDCFNLKQKESEDYKNLYDYICQLYDVDILDGMILKQIKDFRDKFDYTYKGMKTTLNYFYELRGNDVANSKGIGIIPFVYNEAKQFYWDKKQVKESLTNVDLKNFIETRNTIKIKISDKKASEDYDKLVYLDIDDI